MRRARPNTKQYGFNGLAGCVIQKKARQTGTLVGVYHSDQAGLDDDPSVKWSTVCEVHGVVMGHQTLALALAHSADPHLWCEDCRKPLKPLPHTRDEDCTLDADEQCVVCGVSHSNMCVECEGRGFHEPGCPKAQ